MSTGYTHYLVHLYCITKNI